MRRTFLVFLLGLFFGFSALAQDSLYARQVIKKLSSKEFFGRGYLHNGLDKAAQYIVAELKRFNAQPFFSTGYFEWFDHDVNVFPGKMMVKLNGKLLKPGEDYIVSPESRGTKGKYKLIRRDSVTFFAENAEIPIVLSLQKKLTFSVASKPDNICIIEALNVFKDPKTIEVNIENKVLTKYLSKNICAFFPGTVNNDSMIIISAHYDHLGGMGKSTFFPGANDNASGVSMVLNMVKYYEKNPPKYKTVFIFFAGEEAGLLGSKYFVEHDAAVLPKIKFLLNLDLLGTGDDGMMVVNATEFKPQFEKLKAVNDEKHLVKEIKQRGKARNSDHYWFGEKGVPCFFVYTLGGIKAYHDVFDVEKTLPLTDYKDVFNLLVEFLSKL